jgi:phosphoserine phosphatase
LGKWYGFVEKHNEKFLSGELSYKGLCEFEAQTWKGKKVDELLEIVKTVPFHSGADELICYLKNKGLKLALVSSGLSVLSDWVHERFGFDYSISNNLLHNDGILTGEVKIQVHNDQKAKWVKRILKQFDVKAQESIAIGDSAGDLEMFRVAGHSIAFNSSCKNLEQIATHCVQSENLRDIIPKLPI